ncbi:MAG: winged helix-turn-helix domain-containing protein [Moritella sp.]|uniref:winged helix-turn-helix domain-containing protein n=1 Tax=Moritella sp. TaxID=78556 RepID=UPI0029B475EE|nr:winged helix-turn-helix domain-containing protein [Moritella sp.]MDX2321343.1 winged helix-turn-helix domain-containing protein [Moritella sp.]
MMIVNDNYIVDFDGAIILSLNSGLRTSLGSNEVSLLRYMIQHQGQLLLRQSLMEEVWLNKGIIVEDSSLLHAISNCRKALEDKDTQIIQTQRGKGYIFLGKVSPYAVKPVDKEPDSTRPHTAAETSVATTTAPRFDSTSARSYWLYIAVYLLFTGASFMVWRYFSSPWTSAAHYSIEQFSTCAFIDPSTEQETRFQDVTIYHASGLSLLIDAHDASMSYQDELEVDCE